MAHAFKADPALVDEQAKPKIVDLEMPNARDQLLKLHLLACDGDELGQRFRSRGRPFTQPDSRSPFEAFSNKSFEPVLGQFMTVYQAVKPPSMTRLAPVM